MSKEVANTTNMNLVETKIVNKEIEKKVKKNQNRYYFKPEMLLDNNRGLRRLYEETKELKWIEDENIGSLEKINKLMKTVKEWHYLLCPKYDFDYFMDRCQFYGSKPLIKAHLSRMRQIHKRQLDWTQTQNDESYNYFKV